MNNTDLMCHHSILTYEFRDNNSIIDTLLDYCRIKKERLVT